MNALSSQSPGFSFRKSAARHCLLRLQPPFDIEVDEADWSVMYFVLQGEVTLDCSLLHDGAADLRKGATVLFSAPHRLRREPSKAQPRSFVSTDAAGFLDPFDEGPIYLYMVTTPALAPIQPGRGLVLVPPEAKPTAENLAHLVALMRNELASGAPDARMNMRHTGQIAMVQLARYARLQQKGEAGNSEAGEGSDERLQRAVLAFIDKPELPWTVASLAKIAGMSRARFAARFQDVLGAPPLALLNRFRLQEAAAKLEFDSTQVADVAASVGYHSKVAFVRAFRKEFGLSPQAWRAEVGGGRSPPEAPA